MTKLSSGCNYRLLSMGDDFNGEGLGIEVDAEQSDASLSAELSFALFASGYWSVECQWQAIAMLMYPTGKVPVKCLK
ncbi:MAG: hypothetical protein JJT87_14180 [Halomonas sp.]|nr:hypothetical protein [Halomonas sp.]